MSDRTPPDGGQGNDRTVFAVRIATAIVQALALYLLTDAATAPLGWPATEPRLFDPLLLVAVTIPLVILVGVGQLRGRPLAIWAAAATILVAVLGYWDAARGRAAGFATEELFSPSYRLGFVLAITLFVAQVLVVDSADERRFFPRYARHFDTAWKQAVQLILALTFVGVFWGVLNLGAGLFKLVDIAAFERLIAHRWFSYPATTLAGAVALHVTDVQPSLIRGARALALTLFSWLLPLLAAILLGFLCSLPFISLTPLWKTHFAARLLLFSAALLVFLINCCYQDGSAEQTRSPIKRLAGTLAAIELVPLVGLAIWALALRVGQYGWTVDRLTAAAVTLLVSCYALGYAAATVRSPAWLKRIELTNFVAAYVFLALVLALFTPVADPARLMVASQIAQLKSGEVPPQKFDFVTMRFDGAGWGRAALVELSRNKDGPDGATIAPMAARALAMKTRYEAKGPNGAQPTGDDVVKRIDVLPAGRTIPTAFTDAIVDLAAASYRPPCLSAQPSKCVARFVTLHPGEAEAILFLDDYNGSIFQQDATGRWQRVASVGTPILCDDLKLRLREGDFSMEAHALPDLLVGDQRIDLFPSPLSPHCPPANPVETQSPK